MCLREGLIEGGGRRAGMPSTRLPLAALVVDALPKAHLLLARACRARVAAPSASPLPACAHRFPKGWRPGVARALPPSQRAVAILAVAAVADRAHTRCVRRHLRPHLAHHSAHLDRAAHLLQRAGALTTAVRQCSRGLERER
eukprot:scaffold11869_cov30-Tisochrysis_lutea.AAC.7